ncbi:MAG TPA: GTPase Era, partial [Acidimicrobiales bacterium]|nr:GTPase Era [Acidimicrobiales bacterium]
MRSGFATLVGRPNVGKSTLLNTILGTKVSIVSDKAQTTRTKVRGVLTRPDAQIVFVDTPGIHKPRTLLGEHLNDTASSAIGEVDVVLFVIDATAPLGTGDRWVGARVPPESLCVVNKVDRASPRSTLDQLAAAGELGFAEYFPVSARTGAGVDELVDAIVERLPLGPQLYPDGMVADVPEALWVAELVREQLLAVTREEVPHSI